jgi:FtsZ-binding cell division protein ZapB
LSCSLERDAAEQEAAARKTAAAQVEVDAMRRQADKLALVEREALEQRRNSWRNRLRSILVGTVSAATGAFTGGIGTQAGQRAAEAIFPPK